MSSGHIPEMGGPRRPQSDGVLAVASAHQSALAGRRPGSQPERRRWLPIMDRDAGDSDHRGGLRGENRGEDHEDQEDRERDQARGAGDGGGGASSGGSHGH